jgi:hypothetical protein
MDVAKPRAVVVSIATNGYLKYWKKQVTSLDEHVDAALPWIVYIFTDEVHEAQEHAKTLKNLEVRTVETPTYKWPEATLIRYHLISGLKPEIAAQDLVIYLDADMVVVSSLKVSEFLQTFNSQVCLVRHPGFFRPRGLSLLQLYLPRPKLLLGDIFTLLKFGGLGTWETRISSSAYVRRSKRASYYCGGIWWGPGEKIIEMSETLSERIKADQVRGLIAKWHDESHLNWWASTNPHSVGSTEYCYAPGYSWLSTLSPKVIAVEKGLVVR